MLKKKRLSGGQVLGGSGGGTIGGQSVHVVPGGGSYPTQPGYPAQPAAQPAYPSYPMQGVGSQPPPYPAGGSAPYPTQPPYNPNFPG